jgi:pimeloyl-ACP methyl ester carboxylesterase
MSQPGALSRTVLAIIWLPVGLAMIAAPVWVVWTRTGAVLASHPATIGILGGVVLLGVLAVAWGIATLVSGSRYDRYGDPDHPRHRTPAEQRRRAEIRLALSIPTLLICLALVFGVIYARPFEATPTAVAAMRSDAQVQVNERLTWFEMTTARRNASGDPVQPAVGLIFVPGARVDPRAYARILRPLAAAGYLVVVLREPMNLALPSSEHAESVLSVHPKVRFWAMGGHSLGGVNAAVYADKDPRIGGLFFYASYPASALNRTDLRVTSISGDRDGLATPSDIAETKKRLPVRTKYVVIKGGVHAHFGDYGEQPGDGVPGIDRRIAQAQIMQNTRALLASLPPPPRTR